MGKRTIHRDIRPVIRIYDSIRNIAGVYRHFIAIIKDLSP